MFGVRVGWKQQCIDDSENEDVDEGTSSLIEPSSYKSSTQRKVHFLEPLPRYTMTSISIEGIDEPPISPNDPASHLSAPGPFPSSTANNYYSAIKSKNRHEQKQSKRKKKTLSTLVAEALSVATSPRSPKENMTRDQEPEHIPPVTSFQHDADAFSTGSSMTAPTGKWYFMFLNKSWL